MKAPTFLLRGLLLAAIFMSTGLSAQELAVFGGRSLNILIPDGDASPSEGKGTDFGMVSLSGETGESSFLIGNTGTKVLTVQSVQAGGDFLVLDVPGPGFTLAPGESREIRIRFSPKSEGEQTLTVEIDWGDPGGAYTFDVQGTGALKVLNTNDSGPGSFRLLLALANADPSGSTITFAASLSGQSIDLEPPTLRFESPVDVVASDLAERIEFNGQDGMRIFLVESGQTADFANVVIRDGRTTSSFAGAALVNHGGVRLFNSEVRSNRTRDTGEGGAIVNNGGMRLYGVTVSDNDSGSHGGAIVNNTGAYLYVYACTFEGNVASGRGGAIYSPGQMRVRQSTFYNNASGAEGGAIYLASFGTCPHFNSLENSTLAENSAARGGALFLEGATLDVVHTTIVDNVGTGPGSAGIETGLGRSPLLLSRSIVTGNTPTDFASDANGIFQLEPEGNNLIGSNLNVENIFPVGPLAGVITSPLDPDLEPLDVVREGRPAVRVPRVTSPAIDAAADVENSIFFNGDQLALPRDVNGASDLGAVERQTPPIPSLGARWIPELGVVRVFWEGLDFGLVLEQSSPSTDGPWTEIPAGVIQTDGAERFYDVFPSESRAFFQMRAESSPGIFEGRYWSDPGIYISEESFRYGFLCL